MGFEGRWFLRHSHAAFIDKCVNEGNELFQPAKSIPFWRVKVSEIEIILSLFTENKT